MVKLAGDEGCSRGGGCEADKTWHRRAQGNRHRNRLLTLDKTNTALRPTSDYHYSSLDGDAYIDQLKKEKDRGFTLIFQPRTL